MVYSLPDGLWVISYIMIVDVIWCNNRKAQLLWGGILTVIGVVSELLQRIYVVNGTYDYNDILCYTIPYILYLTLKLLFRWKRLSVLYQLPY